MSCSAVNCTNRSTQGIRLFRFPAQQDRKKIWINNCRRGQWNPTESARLCEVHFEENQFEKNRIDGWVKLKWNAVPTIFNVPNPPKRVMTTRKSKYKRPDAVEDNVFCQIPDTVFVNADTSKDINSSNVESCINCHDYINEIAELKKQVETLKKETAEKEIPVIRFDDKVKVIKQEFIDKIDHRNDHQLLKIGSDQVFNTVIKQELIDEIDYNNDHKLLEIGTVCQAEEEVKTVDTEIKVEKHIIGICEFEGTVLNNSHSSKLITHISSDNRPNLQDTHQKCNICNLLFNSKRLLTSHMKIHTIKNKETFICDICNISYYRKSYLRKHLLLHIGENPFICNKTFSDKPNFDIHKRTDTGKKTYKCDICYKTFTASKSLITHTRIHTGVKPFKCDFCEKAFAARYNLKKHTRTHSGEKPYKCDICDRRFSDASCVNSHKRTHTGEKPFKCELCGKRFTRTYHLKIHKRTHTGEKPYECDICSKTFRVKFGLKRHIISNHTKEYQFKCDICNKAFPFASYLQSHSKTHSNKGLLNAISVQKTFTFSRKNIHLNT